MPSTGTALDTEVRRYVYRVAADAAHIPSAAEIAAGLDRPVGDIEASLRRLGEQKMLILAPGTTNIWAANPFCGVPSAFSVQANQRSYWAICIWDALGIPAALGADGSISARCGHSGEPLHLEVRAGELTTSAGIVHFAVPARRWWENIGFT